MPELPEVETTRRGISPHVMGRCIETVIVRQASLRWPVPEQMGHLLTGQRLTDIQRRGKYLLFHTGRGCMLIHLGMSGSLRLVSTTSAAGKHDHVDIVFAGGASLRFADPRRFGSILWAGTMPEQHPLLIKMGPEPLGSAFSGAYLHSLSRGRRTPVKHFIMDSTVVPGVGNIYANEALYLAGINPRRQAGRLSAQRYDRLAGVIRGVLEGAIAVGGTTLRDFVGGDGKPGYFRQSLVVYGQAGQPCPGCGRTLKELRMNQRSTVYCSHCQR